MALLVSHQSLATTNVFVFFFLANHSPSYM